MAKIFDWQANKWIIDTVSWTQLTNTNMVLKNTSKGQAGYFNWTTSQLVPASTITSAEMTICIWFRINRKLWANLQWFCGDFSGAWNYEYFGIKNDVLYYSSVNNLIFQWVTKINSWIWYHTVITIKNLEQKIYLNWLLDWSWTLVNDKVDIRRIGNIWGWSYDFWGEMVNFKMYNTILTQSEINKEYKEFLALQPIQPPKTNFIKESNRGQVNFDLNIAGNNYVTVADANSLDFGTGSFTAYWECEYPFSSNTATATYNAILSKWCDWWLTVANTWWLMVRDTLPNSIFYFDNVNIWNTTWWNNQALVNNIPKGTHKFVFQRDNTAWKLRLYVDWSLVWDFSIANFPSVTNAQPLFIGVSKTTTVRNSANIKNVRLWNTAKTWQQALSNDRANQVLDLPMNEWQGLTVYDKSWNNNNWTITSTSGKPWKKIQVKSDIVFKEDFSFEKADWNNVVPRGWIAGTGKYKIATELTGNSIIKKGTNYLQNTIAGTIAYPIKWAYWSIEFTFCKLLSTSTLLFYLSSSWIGDYTVSRGYTIWVSTTGQLRFNVMSNWLWISMFTTVANYIQTGNCYRIEVTRSINSVFSVYIKWGQHWNNYVLVSTIWGSGTNPFTNSAYISWSFFGIHTDGWDRITDIIAKSTI